MKPVLMDTAVRILCAIEIVHHGKNGVYASLEYRADDESANVISNLLSIIHGRKMPPAGKSDSVDLPSSIILITQ